MIFQKLGLSPQSLKTLLGAILIKFSTAVITCWGNINLYILSQFHNQGTKITPQTNSVILLVSVPLMVAAMLGANRLCLRFGYQFVIRVCCFGFFLAPLVSLLSFNIYTFSIFSILVPGSMYALISVPVLNCIWTQFPDSKNKSTALLVIAFGLGSITWNFLFMNMINPLNEDTVDQHHEISFFREEVTRNVRRTCVIGFCVTGGLAVLGSFLLERRVEEVEDLREEKEEQEMDSSKGTNTEDSLKRTLKKGSSLTYKQALRDQRFLIIMTISILTGLYEIYLMTNFKIIFMPIISDDHFLSYSSMMCSVVSIVGAFLWGCLGDLKGIYFTILVLSVLDFGGKLFSDFAMDKPTIFVMVVLIGLISKSMTTIAGPGFVEIFGLKLGTELLPLKGVAIILGYIFVPLLQIATARFLSPHQYLICISFLSVITVCCAVRLYILRCRQLREDKDEDQAKSNQKERQIQKEIKMGKQIEQKQNEGKDGEIGNGQSKERTIKNNIVELELES